MLCMYHLEDELIKLSFFPHSDLLISWSNVIEESISTETGRFDP